MMRQSSAFCLKLALWLEGRQATARRYYNNLYDFALFARCYLPSASSNLTLFI